jgi:ribosomal protein S25
MSFEVDKEYVTPKVLLRRPRLDLSKVDAALRELAEDGEKDPGRVAIERKAD